MDGGWQTDASSRPSRYPQQTQSNGSSHQPHLSADYGFESYQANPAASHGSSMATSPVGTPHRRTVSGDVDIKMEDADPYNSMKYPPRPSHHQRPSGQFLSQQDSARKFSPSKGHLSQSYTPMSSQAAQSPYGHFPSHSSSARQSPTRSAPYTNVNQSYYTTPCKQKRHTCAAHRVACRCPDLANMTPIASSRPPVLPPIQASNASPDSYYPNSATAQFNAMFGRDAKSPRPMRPAQSSDSPRGSIPRFTKLKSTQDLQPRVNSQPAFRRANPEGGFISPLQALTTHLPSTYRICNPSFKYESSRNPRRVLTKPSKGLKNDGFDNEDSDYILYVNDILGNEDNGHKNRYLILDVLGQGTFGQVVKCQNLKTQEVVAVKVVKNRTAYFNQSMMEVSVLDLVSNLKRGRNTDGLIMTVAKRET